MEQTPIAPQPGFGYLQNISAEVKQQKTDLAEGKKESIESIRYSADTVLRDARLKETIGKIFGGIFGMTILFSSITNVITDLKSKKRSPWIYSRIILDFTASGTLIGYAIEKTLLGLIAGISIGIITLIIELASKTNH